MKNPKGSQNIGDRFCKWLATIYSIWYVRTIIVPLALVIPPALITTLYTNESLKTFLRVNFPDFFNFIAPIGHENVVLFNLFVLIYPAIFVAIGAWIAQKAESNGLSVSGLLALLASLDQVVGVKNTRFEILTTNNTLTKETAFEVITNPRLQIEEIIRAICDFFNATRNAKSKPLIRVTLAVMKGKKVVDIPVFFPTDEPIRSTTASLSQPHSAIVVAATTRKMVLISDISKELKKPESKRKFVNTGNDVDNTGSIICYPIQTRSGVPYVVSIHCEEPSYFKDEFKDLYEHSLQRFALRMSVEHSLLTMKEKLCG